MKYSFETSHRNGKNQIKIDVSLSGGFSVAASKTIEKPDNVQFWNDNELLVNILSDIIDNMRLTVKERDEAIYDAKEFIEYVMTLPVPQEDGEKRDERAEQLIVENGDPSVENVSDEELINAE